MHIIFGVSALVMMIATLWLLAKDHNRQWKTVQLTNREKAAWVIQARHDSLADQYSDALETYDADIRRAQSEPVDPEKISEFKSLVSAENKRLNLTESDFSALDTALNRVNEAATQAANLRQEVQATGEVDNRVAGQELIAAEKAVARQRERLFKAMDTFIAEARHREKLKAGQRKFVAADRTAAVSQLGLMVGGGATEEEKAALQGKIDGYTQTIAEMTEELAAANNYRTRLDAIRAEVDASRANLDKDRSSMEMELQRLADQRAATQPTGLSRIGEWITRWPILNALYSGNVQIDQIWLPDLTINYNFSQAARFDRCKTCHQDISTPAAGTATDPAFPTLSPEERDRTIKLATPESAPALGGDPSAIVRDVYGLVLTNDNMIGYEDQALVHYVLPETAAAEAGLESGDIIEAIDGISVYDKESVENYLATLARWGELVTLKVRRGLDHPYTTHPRLDLFLSDSSPHPEGVFGCTVCHDGQGSGTSFPWTSHTPNDADQQARWIRDLGWFDNHHWIFPMKPERFLESNCLKCHFDKGSLEPSERFLDPPAPKLVQGWTLVEDFGCYGCHEINGFDGPHNRIGPDMRLEPNYNEVAAQMLRDTSLNSQERAWAQTLVRTPDNKAVREQLFTAVRADARLASSVETRDEARLSSATHKLADGLKDVEVPGTYRKTGPSLRYVKSKVEYDWLYSWIRLPKDFRPSTKMAQFFGLWEHLETDPAELEVSQRYEAVEIRALAEFLLYNSSEFEYLTPPEGVTESASAERGQWLFESRGCLACHSHEKFPGIAEDQGPELSRLSAKFTTGKGKQWLYSWVKQPHRYHVRTKMPELYLDPIVELDANNQPTGKVTDPAADIVAFLLSGNVDWQPANVPERGWSGEDLDTLADLAVEWLASDAIPTQRAREFVNTGIPDSLEPKLKADEKLLLKKNFANRTEQLQNFVARRTISKYGCFGCHDIPGFEDAKPIGTGLADWGRKDSSRLAFENIHAFLAGPGNPKHTSAPDISEQQSEQHANVTSHGTADTTQAGGHGHLEAVDFVNDGISYYIQSLISHGRDGFIWQKLRAPRSYDYKTTANKKFNERLRMPKFQFTEEEREAVITFVLGLVSEPPAEKFIYRPDPRQEAIVKGRAVLERFNCAGCHTLRMETWEVAFKDGDFESPVDVQDFPFLQRHFTNTEIAESLVTDDRGRLHTRLVGQPVMSEETGQPLKVDIDGLPLEPDDAESDPYYRFTLYEDTLIGGESWFVGIQDPMVPGSRTQYGPAEGRAFPAWGGDLARYLFPRVIAHAQQVNPQVKGAEAWGWLPPALMAEGDKVQTGWLHAFLMDPIAIRPAAVMRMPNFHMSSDEAATLVDYFAATSESEFPYEFNRRQRASYLAEQEQSRPDLFGEAMNIVVDGNYCVKCHAVGEFQPQGDPTTFGPNLASVHPRLRPEFVRNWIANPKRILPYTGMPVNIPFNPAADHLGGVAQKLFAGTSLDQLDGLVDLLMNFDTYAKRQTQVTPLVEAAAAASAPDQASNTGAANAPRSEGGQESGG